MLHLAKHICEEDSEKEICLASSHTLLTSTLSPTLATPDDSKEGRKRNPRIKETERHHLINVPQEKKKQTCYLSLVRKQLKTRSHCSDQS